MPKFIGCWKLHLLTFHYGHVTTYVNFFRVIFDCDVTKSNDFSFGRSKASYVISDGLGPHLSKMLIADVKKCESGFTIMYDETTNVNNDKQMDILIRYKVSHIINVCKSNCRKVARDVDGLAE